MVETLLLDIVPEAQKPFLDCFDAYWNSIQQLNPNFKFSFKSKFFAYLEATGQNHKMKEINFLDNNHWNLNSPALDNLKAFLYKNIH